MKLLRLLIIVFLVIVSYPELSASYLILNEKAEKSSQKILLQNNGNVLFMDEDIVLSVMDESEDSISQWNPASFYFILYPLKSFNISGISAYGNVLYQDTRRVIFESKKEILNDHAVFHQFKIIRIFDRPLSQPKNKAHSIPYYKSRDNPVIGQLVNQVNQDSLENFIATLQEMERYTTLASAQESSNYIKAYFEYLGYDSIYFQTYNPGWIPNVIALKYGLTAPEEIYLAGGHYDVYAAGAPGADDNGSGTAAIMETARVLSNMNFNKTLKFVLFSGEELGLYGSESCAQNAASENENILGMINMDMIGYVAPGDAVDVDVVSNDISADLYASYQYFTGMYVPDLTIVDGHLPFGASSDHASFWNAGYKAIFPFEDSDHYSPYIHSSSDVLGTSVNSLELAQLGTQSVVATLAGLAEIAETRLCGYIQSAADLSPLPGAQITVNDTQYLSDENGYFSTNELFPGQYTVSITSTGYEDLNSTVELQENYTLQQNFLLIPSGASRPFVHVIDQILDDDIIGNSNGDDDHIADAGESIELTLQLWNTGNQDAGEITLCLELENPSDTQWITIFDSIGTVSGLSAEDSSFTEPPMVFSIAENTPDQTIISFLARLDYGIYSETQLFSVVISTLGTVLIVEDDNGDGGLGDYTRVLDSLDIHYDIADENVESEILNQYRTSIWFCGNDYTNTLSAVNQNTIANYLNNGGNLLICGNDIGYDIHSDPFYNTYLKAGYIEDGQQIYSVNGIAEDPISGDFTSGMSISDNWVDVIQPLSGAVPVFTYSSDAGKICALSYSGEYKLVYLGFNFENMPVFEDQQQLMNHILNFLDVNQVVSVSSAENFFTDKFFLSQNYPNPFNPSTRIRYRIPEYTHVNLTIFNALGQKIQTLVNREQSAGTYEALFKGHDWPSGIYYYHLETTGFKKTGKMILAK